MRCGGNILLLGRHFHSGRIRRSAAAPMREDERSVLSLMVFRPGPLFIARRTASADALQASQFSTLSPRIRLNSLMLAVTTVASMA